MISVKNVENFGSEDAEIKGSINKKFKVKGKDFDTFKSELKEVFEKYNLKNGENMEDGTYSQTYRHENLEWYCPETKEEGVMEYYDVEYDVTIENGEVEDYSATSTAYVNGKRVHFQNIPDDLPEDIDLEGAQKW
ncbi:MAG: hypothetical protein PWP73_1043 [Methanococcus sp.]|jgi:hypothetical protein|uniref:Uncharacterized protein n=1 Tax=Methanococcus maripaludis KA1 TaxID=637914 RepID=A0A2Z5PGA1_METMI|nr:hypothetical protein [Methanococcus maripaludis]MDK2929445.1 hypothetical protein [Methanococcus sp.]BAP60608.1 hypothetical protein MMKA1_04910 [Methanococcus maripaludis KA1]